MNTKVEIVTIVYNTAYYVYKFRINLIRDLVAQGFRVVVISPTDEYVDVLRNLGIEHHEISMSQYGMNPIREVSTTLEIYKALKAYRPVCSLHYTIKPNIFGGIAAALAKTPVINNVAGAGRAFSKDQSLFARFISSLYRIGLSKSHRVFFQNFDDMQLFLENNLVRPEVAERIPGSGVDLAKYSMTETSPAYQAGTFHFLFVGRLLKEKGIYEYFTAAQHILRVLPDSKILFEIVGEIDDSGACISDVDLQKYLADDRILYHGAVTPDRMPAILDGADCVVLPSYYREGVPRSLLEASAMFKPLITTDNVGCREVVDEGVNGYKVPVRDPEALAEAMLRMLSISTEERLEMGRAGRRKVEAEFDEMFVLQAYRRAITSILAESLDK